MSCTPTAMSPPPGLTISGNAITNGYGDLGLCDGF